MSEKRSWDIAPKKAPTSRNSTGTSVPQRAPARLRPPTASTPMDMVRSARAQPVRTAPQTRTPQSTVRSAPRRTAPAPKGRLRDRRQHARRAALVTALVIFGGLLVAGISATWLPQLRIQAITTSGPRADALETLAFGQLEGTYAFIVPRDSIFFFPANDLRNAALDRYPEIADLAISRTGFTAIEIVALPRAKAFIWCGTSIDAVFPTGQCFNADAGGLLYGVASDTEPPAATDTATTTSAAPATTLPADEDLRVFAPLTIELREGQSPLGARVTQAWAIPDALLFVEAIKGMNVPVSALELRGDEADLWLNGPTRITYVLGREKSAAQLAVSVIPTLDLTDGSIQYLDLRFNGKAYLKRYGE